MSAAANVARDLIAARRPADAIKTVLDALSTAPDDAELHCVLAQANLVLKQPGEALKAATRAVQLAPDDEWGHRLRSISLRLLKRPAEAVAAAAESVRLEPDLAFAQQTLGEAYLAAGNTTDAYAAAYEARRLDPDSADTYDLLGRCMLNQGRPAEAEAAFRHALQLEPDFAMAHNNLGVALRRQGRGVEAVHAFNAAAKLDPSSEVARKNVYSGTRALIGGGFAVVALITLIRAAGFMTLSHSASLFTVLAGILLAVSVIWLVRNRPARITQLPQTAVAYYRAENRKLRPVQLIRIGSLALGIGLLIVGLALQSSAVLLLAIAATIIGYGFSARIWHAISTRFRS